MLLGNTMPGMAIKTLRMQKGLSQSELGKKVNYTGGWLSKVERGEIIPSADKLIPIVQYFNTSLDYIFGLSDIPKPAENVFSIMKKHINLYSRQYTYKGDSYSMPILSISKTLFDLFDVTAKAEQFKKDGVPDNVLDSWIDPKIQYFIDQIHNNKAGETIEYILLTNNQLDNEALFSIAAAKK